MEEDRGAQKPLELAIKRIVTAKHSVKSCDNNGDSTLLRLFLASSVSGAIHYGWGLQISILTPYAQLLGVPHMFASLICSSGPLAGILVNPILNYYGDRCTMRMGRRRPFILVGCFLICILAMVIALSSDIGHYYLGDPREKCGAFSIRKGASAMLIVGFWLLDFANNTIRGVTRAMMDDLSVGNNHGLQIGYNIFSLWGSMGVILGCAAGATGKWPEWFPWLNTEACGVCVNIKGAFFTSVVLIVISMTLTMNFADEQAIETKLALYPFFVYNTDWMGREIYHGNPRGSMEKLQMYTNGFRKGCIGMILCVIGRTVTTAFIPKLCQNLTSVVVWSLSNFLLFLLMLAAIIISLLSTKENKAHSLDKPDLTLEALALGIFALMGIPAAITQCLPMSLAFQIAVAEGGSNHGDTIGAITIAVVMPQLITVLTTGPVDNAYGGGGNAPGFVLSAALAFLSWILGLLFLSKKSDISCTTMPLL